MSTVDAFSNFFSTNGFMPHGMCLLWKPAVLWMMVAGNLLIALSYFILPYCTYLLNF